MTDVTAQHLDILLIRERLYLTLATFTLGHIEVILLRCQRLILLGLRVVIYKLHGRNGVLSLMTRHGQELIDHASLQSAHRQARLIRGLGIIGIKILREIHHRLLHQLQVTRTTDGHLHREGVVGLQLGLVNLRLHRELTYTAREISRTRGQRVYFNLDARCLDLLLHLHITRAAVEESLKWVYVAVLLHHNTIEGDGWHLQFARHLWEHHILAPRHRLIVTPVKLFYLEALLLRQGNLLRMEAFQVGHFTLQLCQTDQRIDLVGQQHRLLFHHTFLGCAHLDKQV